jgi:virginiamycin B lyase
VPGMTRLRRAARKTFALLALLSVGPGDTADAANSIERRSIGALNRTIVIHLGKTADWVAINADAVWVGSTGPFAVHRIDPATNKRVASVLLPGEPCAGLAIGAGSLWVPLCSAVPLLAKVDLKSNRLVSVFKTGPAAAEGGVTASPGNVWLVIDKQGSLARVDPDTGIVRQITHLPAGSYNPIYSDGKIWVTHADGSDVTSVDAATGAILATFPTGPGPRFLTAGGGAIWTLNQGDGSVTRIDTGAKRATITTALGIPGKGGDIGFGGGMIWATVAKVPLSLVAGASGALLCQWVGPGGDSLGIGHGAIWLTDYHAGTISRIDLEEAILHCRDY